MFKCVSLASDRRSRDLCDSHSGGRRPVFIHTNIPVSSHKHTVQPDRYSAFKANRIVYLCTRSWIKGDDLGFTLLRGIVYIPKRPVYPQIFYICRQTHTHTHTNTHTHTHKDTRTQTQTYIYMYLLLYLHSHALTHIHTSMYTPGHTESCLSARTHTSMMCD